MSFTSPGKDGSGQDLCPPHLIGKVLFDDEEYDRRFRALQTYMPLIKSLISQGDGCSVNSSLRNRLQCLSVMLMDFNTKMKEGTLTKCEVVLLKLKQKVEVNPSPAAPDQEPQVANKSPLSMKTPALNPTPPRQDTLVSSENKSIMRTLKLAAARTARNSESTVSSENVQSIVSPEMIRGPKMDDFILPSSLEKSRDKLKKLLPVTTTSEQFALSTNEDPTVNQMKSPRCNMDIHDSKSPCHWNPSPPRPESKQWKVIDEYVHEDNVSASDVTPDGSESSPVRSGNLQSFSLGERPVAVNVVDQVTPLLSDVKSSAQRIRAKLEQEISQVHRVGTSTGGSLRALVNKDSRLKFSTTNKEADRLKTPGTRPPEKIVEIDMFSREHTSLDKRTGDKVKDPNKSLKGLYAPRFGNIGQPSLTHTSPKSKVLLNTKSDKVESKPERTRVVKSPIRFPVEGVSELKRTVVIPFKSSANMSSNYQGPSTSSPSTLASKIQTQSASKSSMVESEPSVAQHASTMFRSASNVVRPTTTTTAQSVSTLPLPASSMIQIAPNVFESGSTAVPSQLNKPVSGTSVAQPNFSVFQPVSSNPVIDMHSHSTSKNTSILANMTQEEIKRAVDLNLRNLPSPPTISAEILEKVRKFTPLDRPAVNHHIHNKNTAFLPGEHAMSAIDSAIVKPHSIVSNYVEGEEQTQMKTQHTEQLLANADRNFILAQTDTDLRKPLADALARRCDPRSYREPLIQAPQPNLMSGLQPAVPLVPNEYRGPDGMQENSRNRTYPIPVLMDPPVNQHIQHLPNLQNQEVHMQQHHIQQKFQPLTPLNHSSEQRPQEHQPSYPQHRPDYYQGEHNGQVHRQQSRDFYQEEQERDFYYNKQSTPRNDFYRDDIRQEQHRPQHQWTHQQELQSYQRRPMYPSWERYRSNAPETFHQPRTPNGEVFPRSRGNQDLQASSWKPSNQLPRGHCDTLTPHCEVVSMPGVKEDQPRPPVNEKYRWSNNVSSPLLSPPHRDQALPVPFRQYPTTPRMQYPSISASGDATSQFSGSSTLETNPKNNPSQPIRDLISTTQIKQPLLPTPIIHSEGHSPILPFPKPENVPHEERPRPPVELVRPTIKVNAVPRRAINDRQCDRRRLSMEHSERHSNSKRYSSNNVIVQSRRSSSSSEDHLGRRGSNDQKGGKSNNTKELVSPLNSLYDSTTIPKTGKGYGLQSFKIPKIKRDPEPVQSIPVVPPTQVEVTKPTLYQVPVTSPVHVAVPTPSSQTASPTSTQAEMAPPALPITPIAEASMKSEISPMPSSSSHSVDEELVEAFGDKSYTSNETKELLEYLKKVRKIFSSTKLKKIKKLIESSSDESDSNASKQGRTVKDNIDKLIAKAKVNLLNESLDSELKSVVISDDSDQELGSKCNKSTGNLVSSGSEVPTLESLTSSPAKVSPNLRSRKVRHQSEKYENKELTAATSAEIDVLKNKNTEVEVTITNEDDKELTGIKAAGIKKNRRRNSLEILQADIRDMFISSGVLTASGRRLCTILKQDERDAVKVLENTKAGGLEAAISTDEEDNNASLELQKSIPKRSIKKDKKYKRRQRNSTVNSDSTNIDDDDSNRADVLSVKESVKNNLGAVPEQSSTKSKVKRRGKSPKRHENLIPNRRTMRSSKISKDGASSNNLQNSVVISSSESSDDDSSCQRPQSRAASRVSYTEYFSAASDGDDTEVAKRNRSSDFYKNIISSPSEDDDSNKANIQDHVPKRKQKKRKKKTKLSKKKMHTLYSDSDDVSNLSSAKEFITQDDEVSSVKTQTRTHAALTGEEESRRNNQHTVCNNKSCSVLLEKNDYTHLLSHSRPFSSSSDESPFEAVVTRTPRLKSRSVARRGCRNFPRHPVPRKIVPLQASSFSDNEFVETRQTLRTNLDDIITRLSTEDDVQGTDLDGTQQKEASTDTSNLATFVEDSEDHVEVKKKNLGPKRKRKSGWSFGVIKKPKRPKLPVEEEALGATIVDEQQNLESKNESQANNDIVTPEPEPPEQPLETLNKNQVAQHQDTRDESYGELVIDDRPTNELMHAVDTIRETIDDVIRGDDMLTENVGPSAKEDVQKLSQEGVVEPMEVVSVDAGVESQTELIRNVDLEYTFCEDKPTTYPCKLCSFSGKAIVLHYAQVHPNEETYVSRLQREDAQNAISESMENNYPLKNPELKVDKSTKRRRKAMLTCRICFSKMLNIMSFYDHCCSHTGEYRYQCDKCKGKLPTKAGFHSHVRYHHFHLRGKESIRLNTLHEVSADNMDTVFGYLCSGCNFVQLQKANIENHIRLHHSEDTDVKAVCINMHVQTNRIALCKRRKRSVDTNNLVDNNEEASGDNMSDHENHLDQGHISTKEPSTPEVNMTVFLPTNETLDLEEEKSIQDKRKSKMEEMTKKLSDKTFLTCANRSSLVDVLSKRNEEFTPEVSPVPSDDANNMPSAIAVTSNISCEDSLLQTNETNNEREDVDPLQDHPVSTTSSSCHSINVQGNSLLPSILPANEHQLVNTNESASKNQKVLDLINRVKQSTTTKSVDTELTVVKIKQEKVSEENTRDNLERTQTKIYQVGPLEVRKMNDTQLLSCMVQGCKYKTIQVLLFVAHIREQHTGVMWDGFCEACDLVVSHSVPLEAAVLHLLKNHLLVDCTLSLAESDPLAQDTSSRATANTGVNSRIRLRRLSGDTLSIAKAPAVQDEASTNEFMGCIIENVVSLANETNTNESNIQDPEENVTETNAQLPFTLTEAMEPRDSMLAVTVSPSSRAKNHASLPAPSRLVGIFTSKPQLVKLTPDVLKRMSQTSQLSRVVEPTSTDVHSLESSQFNSNLSANVENFTSENQQVNISSYCKSLKSTPFYEAMLEDKRLRHLFKCMSALCSFTTNNSQKFVSHLRTHFQSSGGYHCAYCRGVTFHQILDILKHIKNTHCHCLYQCAYCFYRAISPAYIVVHQNTCHTNESIYILQCIPSKGISAPNVKWQLQPEFVLPYICTQSSCEAQVFISSEFRTHLRVNHPQLLVFTCHICGSEQFNSGRLVRHYKVNHGYERYQCGHCIYGTETDEAMLLHMCDMHPNLVPMVVIRVATEIDPFSTVTISPIRQLQILDLEAVNPTDSSFIVKPSTCELMEDENSVNTLPTAQVNISSSGTSSEDELVVVDDVPEKENETNQLLENPFEVVDVEEDPLLEVNNFMEVNQNDLPVFTSRQTRSSPKKGALLSGNTSQQNPAKNLRPGVKKASPEKKVPSKEAVAKPSKPTGSYEFGAITIDELIKTGISGIDLYKCGYNNCEFASSDQSELREHIFCCDLSRDSDTLNCPHCSRGVKTIPLYLDHLKEKHGTKRYGCGLCAERATTSKQVAIHLKSRHRVTLTKCIPLNPVRSDPEVDLFVTGPLKDKWNRKKSLSPSKAKPKFVYQPDEGHLLPIGSIYPYIVTCATCSFTTKVRINMLRHLALHNSGAVVPSQTPLNAVPCLEKNEMMFDKMTNLAASSNTGVKTSISPADLALLPKYVAEQERYVCGASGCTYSSCDENMLLHHLRALHRELDTFECPHCIGDSRTVPIDKIGVHLKMHDIQLYKCAYCFYFDYRRHIVDRHLMEKHRDSKAHILVVRELSTDTPPASETPTDDDVANAWHCGMCDFSCATRADVIVHTSETHGVKSQFKCGSCGLRTQSRLGFDSHYASKHPGMKQDIIQVYYRVGSFATTEQAGFDTSPMWRRNSGVKHIRGILFDEEQENQPEEPDEEPEETEQPVASFGNQDGGSFYVCNLCSSYRTKHKSEFKMHLYKELKYMRFKCSMCGKKTCSRSHMKRHVTRTHPTSAVNFISMPVDKNLEDWVQQVLDAQEVLLLMDVPSKLSSNPSSSKKTAKAKAVAAEVSDDDDGEMEAMESVLLTEYRPAKKQKLAKGPKHNPIPADDSVEDDLIEIDEEDLASGEVPGKNQKQPKNPCRYPCSKCGHKYGSIRGLKIHIRLYHLSAGRWRCNSCEQTQNIKHVMERHCRSAHPDVTEETYSINIVSRTDKIRYDAVFWEREYGIGPEFMTQFGGDDDSSILKPKRNGKFQCQHGDCNFRAKSEVGLRRHMANHDAVASYKCELCDFASTRATDLKKHNTLMHSSEQEYNETTAHDLTPPEWLDVSELANFEPQDELIKPLVAELNVMNIPSVLTWDEDLGLPGEVSYRCGYCLETASCRTLIEAHQRKTHPMLQQLIEEIQSTVELRCTRCSAAANSMQALRDHMSQCSDIKVTVLNCPSCNFTACVDKNMQEHLRVHAKAFQCGHCSGSFAFRGRVRSHSLSVHPDLEVDIIQLPKVEEQYQYLRANVFKTQETRDSNTARKSTTPYPCFPLALKAVARKSTGNSPRKPSPPFSYYGRRPAPVSDSVTIETMVNSSLATIGINQYSDQVNINPLVYIEPLQISFCT